MTQETFDTVKMEDFIVRLTNLAEADAFTGNPLRKGDDLMVYARLHWGYSGYQFRNGHRTTIRNAYGAAYRWAKINLAHSAFQSEVTR